MSDKGKSSGLVPKDSMRNEYDLSKGERGKFYGKVDTVNPLVTDDEEKFGDESSLEIND